VDGNVVQKMLTFRIE